MIVYVALLCMARYPLRKGGGRHANVFCRTSLQGAFEGIYDAPLLEFIIVAGGVVFQDQVHGFSVVIIYY